jgi:hypothetical protein
VFEPVRTALEAPELHIGLLRGLVAAAAVGVLAILSVALRSLVSRRWLRRLRISASSRRLPGLVGPGFVVASVVSLGALQNSLLPMTKAAGTVPALPSSVVMGLALVWAGVAVAGLTPLPLPAGMLLALPGAWRLVAGHDFVGPSWIPWLIVLGTAIGGPLAAETDRDLARTGLTPVMWLVVVGAVYSTVPDTELALVLLGVAIPLALLGLPFRLARMGDGGIAASIGLLLWMAAQEGWPRPGSLVGTIGALALFTTLPIGHRLRRWFRFELHWSRRRRAFAVVAVQFVLAMWAARVAGLAFGAVEAMARLVPAVAAGIAFGIALPMGRRRVPRSGRSSRSRSRTSEPPEPSIGSTHDPASGWA